MKYRLIKTWRWEKKAKVGILELGNVASSVHIGTNKAIIDSSIGWSNLSVLFVPSSRHYSQIITFIKTDHDSQIHSLTFIFLQY